MSFYFFSPMLFPNVHRIVGCDVIDIHIDCNVGGFRFAGAGFAAGQLLELAEPLQVLIWRVDDRRRCFPIHCGNEMIILR